MKCKIVESHYGDVLGKVLLERTDASPKEEKLKRNGPSNKLCKNFKCRGSSDREKTQSTTDSAGQMSRASISSWAKLKIRLSQEDIQELSGILRVQILLGAPARAAENPARGTKLLFL